MEFLTMTAKPTFRADFKPGDGGKTAVYMARPPRRGESSVRLATASLRHGGSTTRRICDWINTRGEKGPWSEITTATVAA